MKLSLPARVVLAFSLLSLPAPAASAQLVTSSGPAATAPTAVRHASELDPNATWRELELPAGFGGPGSVTCLGTLVWFASPAGFHLWSAITKEWTVVPVSPTATITQFNAYAIIEDGNTVHAYATRTGRVESLALPAAPQLHHGSITSAWASIATLGTDAWAFGAFDGEWVHQSLASAAPTVVVNQTTAIVHDGVTAYGFSSYYGDFVPHAAPGAPQLDVQGDTGIAWDASEAAGFSTHSNTWAALTFPSGAGNLVTLQRGYALFEDGAGGLHAYSGSTGEFVAYTPPGGPGSWTLSEGRYVFAVTTGDLVAAYSAGRGQLAEQTFTAPTIQVDDEILVVSDATGVTAFSSVAAEFSATVPGAWTTVRLADAMAWIDDGSFGHAYSLVQNEWAQAPLLGNGLAVIRNAVVIEYVSGYLAFSGRSGNWSHAQSSSPSTFTTKDSGDVFLGFDGSRMLVFDPVIDRWAEVDGAAPATAHDIWRQVVVATDGANAIGYGLMSNVWRSVPLKGAFQELDANSSAGYLLTDTHLYTYAAHGSLSTLSRFPEFSRFQPLSAPLRLLQTAPTGSVVTAFFALAPAFVDAGALGMIFLDAGTLAGSAPLGVVPAGGLMDVALALPRIPALHGVALHVQSLVAPPFGAAPWLSNSIAPVLF